MKRRGFLGKLLGGAAVATVAAPEVKAKVTKAAPIVVVDRKPIPPMPPDPAAALIEDAEIRWKNSMQSVEILVHSRRLNHRIQLGPVHAVQFRRGRAYVTPAEAAALRAHKLYAAHEIWFKGDTKRALEAKAERLWAAADRLGGKR